MTAAEIISEAMGGKEFKYGREGHCPRGKEIGIHAIRGGDIVGDHTVMFIGNSERIEIRHQAHSREIFVGGAVMAAARVSAPNHFRGRSPPAPSMKLWLRCNHK